MKVMGLSKQALSAVITALIVLDLLALAGFAVRRTTVTTRTTRSAADAAPVSAAPPAAIAPLTAPSAPAVAIAAGGATVSKPSSGKGTGTSSAPPVTVPTSGIPPVKDAAIGKCPIKTVTPDQLGGVKSLVPFAPAFGPFSAEAFAAVAAYEPELELLGPILAEYPTIAPVIEPAVDPLLQLFATGTNAFYGVIAPFYGPQRTAVLSAETKLATALAPYSVQLAGTPLAGCVVDLEAALVGDTKSDGAKHASKTPAASSGSGLLSVLTKLAGRG